MQNIKFGRLYTFNCLGILY